jgi:hypothetical protein
MCFHGLCGLLLKRGLEIFFCTFPIDLRLSCCTQPCQTKIGQLTPLLIVPGGSRLSWLPGGCLDATQQASAESLMANWVETALEGEDIYVTGCTKTEALQHIICADLKWTDDNDLVRGGLFSWPDSVAGQEWLAAVTELSAIARHITQHRHNGRRGIGRVGSRERVKNL